MSQPNDLEFAKQGDATAIGSLINRHLESNGITVVKSTLNNGCLQVILESQQAPNQQTLVAWIRKSLIALNPASIDRVRVYCRQTGVDFIYWIEQFTLKATSSTDTHQCLEQDKEQVLHQNHILPKKGYSFIPLQGQAVIAAVLVIGLLSSCVYQIGYPWNCKQAKEATNEAKSDSKRAINKVKYFNPKDGSFELKVRLFVQANMEELEAERKESEMCNN